MATAEQPLIEATKKLESFPRGGRAAATGETMRLLPKLIEAFRWSRKNEINEISDQMAAALEDAYPTVSKQLRKVRNATPTLMQLPENLLSFESARFGLDAVIMPANIKDQILSFVEEHSKREELEPYRLEPQHKVLLYGPTGNGKTTLAEAIAFELQVPFLRVKYSGMVESYLGVTGQRLNQIVEYASTNPCVVFMDEFDGIGIDRAGSQANGAAGNEIQRVVNQLLISLDRLPSTCVLVTATNLPGLIDGALKSRFDLILEIPDPTPEIVRECAMRALDPSLTAGRDLASVADKMANLGLPNLREVTALCKRIRRNLALHNGTGIESLLQNAKNQERIS